MEEAELIVTDTDISKRVAHYNYAASPLANVGPPTTVADVLDAICWASTHELTLRFSTIFDRVRIVHIHTVEATGATVGTATRYCLNNNDVVDNFVGVIEDLKLKTSFPAVPHSPNCGVSIRHFNGLTAVIYLAYAEDIKVQFESNSSTPSSSAQPALKPYIIRTECPDPNGNGTLYANSKSYADHSLAPDTFDNVMGDLTLKVSQARNGNKNQPPSTSSATPTTPTNPKPAKLNRRPSPASPSTKNETDHDEIQQDIILNDIQLVILEQLSHWYSLCVTPSGHKRVIETEMRVADEDFKTLKAGNYIEAITTDNLGQRWGITERGLKLMSH